MPQLIAVTNGTLSDAPTQLNQYRNLYRGGANFDSNNGYGVPIDGVTDASPSLTTLAGVLPATGGCTVVFTPGTYLLKSTVTFNTIDNLTILGYGATIKLDASTNNFGGSGSAYRYGLELRDCTNCQIVGLDFDGNGVAFKALPSTEWFACLGLVSSVVDIRSTTKKLVNALVEACTFTNVRTHGIAMRLADGVAVKRCRFVNLYNDNNGDAAHVAIIRSNNVSVDNSYFDGSNSQSLAIGVVCAPGSGGGGGSITDYMKPYLNFAQVLNYTQMASFTAPAAAAATSTATVSYATVTAPAAAPGGANGGALSDGGAGALPAGTYTVGYTYVNSFGETTISPTAITASLAVSHQIGVAAFTGLPNYVTAVKLYITATSGTSTLGFTISVPVTANATSATNINVQGNTVTAPGANNTAAAESDTVGPAYISNDFYFLCATPGSGANAGLVPPDAMKVTAVDQGLKTITVTRMDGAGSGSTVPLNWSGQKVYLYSIATRLFCQNISVTNSTFLHYLGGASSGVFMEGVKNFVTSNNVASDCGDIMLDHEHCVKGVVTGNTVIDNPSNNACIGALYLIQDVVISGNQLGWGGTGVLVYSGNSLINNLNITNNVVRGSNIGIQVNQNFSDIWDNLMEGVTISGNTVRAGITATGVGTVGQNCIQVGRNASRAADLGGYARDVLISNNILEESSERAIVITGIDGCSIVGNQFSNIGYQAILDDNTKMQSTRVLVKDNILNNVGYRFGQGMYGTTVATTDTPRIGYNAWRNTDSTIDNARAFYIPAAVNAHPTGPDFLPVGTSMMRTSGGVLLVSTDTLLGTDGTWKTLSPAVQTPAFTTPFTPDPTLGDTIAMGLLTAAITVNAPSTNLPGQTLTFVWTQDTTGGRVISYNAVYKQTGTGATIAIATTLSTVTTDRFVCVDSTHWRLMSRITGQTI